MLRLKKGTIALSSSKDNSLWKNDYPWNLLSKLKLIYGRQRASIIFLFCPRESPPGLILDNITCEHFWSPSSQISSMPCESSLDIPQSWVIWDAATSQMTKHRDEWSHNPYILDDRSLKLLYYVHRNSVSTYWTIPKAYLSYLLKHS